MSSKKNTRTTFSFCIHAYIYIYIQSIEKTKRRVYSFIHLLSRWIHSSFYFFFPLFFFFLVHVLRLASWWWRRRESTHIFIHKSMPILLCVSKYYTKKRALFRFFLVYIHTDANLSDEDDVDIHIVRSFRPSYDLINNSLFVHIRILRYTLKEKETFFLHCFDDLHCTHAQECTHAYTRSDHCSIYSPLDICRASLTIGRRSSTHFRSLMFLLSTITFFPFLILTLSLIMHSTTKS
jgi:hypothetical protein